jgi:hypoxanthine-DNA glycosylase
MRILAMPSGRSFESCSAQARGILPGKGGGPSVGRRALWDTLKGCRRLGSLDTSITEEVANDFPALFAESPNITHVFFNGSKAEKAFRRHVLPALHDDCHVFARLPSTSPADAAMRLEAKVQAWSVVKKVMS